MTTKANELPVILPANIRSFSTGSVEPTGWTGNEYYAELEGDMSMHSLGRLLAAVSDPRDEIASVSLRITKREPESICNLRAELTRAGLLAPIPTNHIARTSSKAWCGKSAEGARFHGAADAFSGNEVCAKCKQAVADALDTLGRSK